MDAVIECPIFVSNTHSMSIPQNPFTELLVINYIRFIKRDVPEYKTDLQPGDYYDVEQQKATRLYRVNAHCNMMMELSAPGVKLVVWIMYHLQDNAVSIKLNEKKLCAEVFKCSERQFRRTKAELIKAAIIAKKENNDYWVNPRYFASESRLKLYPECAVRVAIRREDY